MGEHRISDKELLIKIHNFKDQHAFKEFFSRYYARLVGFSLYFVKTHENAEDVVEEVFYKFLKSEKNWNRIDKINSYLFRMTKNECFDFLRINKNDLHLESYEHIDDFQFPLDPAPDQQLEGKEFEELVNITIDSFPPKRKVIFNLSREERLSYSEIAKLLDISSKTVESHMAIALKTLRAQIADYDSGIDTKIRRIDTQMILLLALSFLGIS